MSNSFLETKNRTYHGELLTLVQSFHWCIVGFVVFSVSSIFSFWFCLFFFYVLFLFCLLCFSKLNVWDGVFCCRFVFSVFLVFSTFLVSSIVCVFPVLFVRFSLFFPEQSQSCSHFDLGGPFLAWHFARQGQFQPVRSASSEKRKMFSFSSPHVNGGC